MSCDVHIRFPFLDSRFAPVISRGCAFHTQIAEYILVSAFMLTPAHHIKPKAIHCLFNST